MKRQLRSYTREEVRDAITHGARCVTFYYCFSLVFITVDGESEIVVVHRRLQAIRAGFWHTLGTAILGWWGHHGVFLTPI